MSLSNRIAMAYSMVIRKIPFAVISSLTLVYRKNTSPFNNRQILVSLGIIWRLSFRIPRNCPKLTLLCGLITKK